jgi:hypothetical protein
MNVKELRAKYEEDLRARLTELDDERAQIVVILQGGVVVEERRATSDDRAPRKKAVWSDARRKEQGRRMRRLHRQGVFKR